MPAYMVISMTDDLEFFPHIPEKKCRGILQIAFWDTEDGVNFRSIHIMYRNGVMTAQFSEGT